MKANQPFRAHDEAVSPVIGVILMVAITVVLAAVVFVLVSNLSKNSNQSAPNISFNQDKAAKTLTIISADASDWKDIRILLVTGSGAGCGGTNASGTALAAVGTAQTPATRTIGAGDKVTITDATAGQTCNLQLTYAPANQLLGTWTFNF